MKRNCKLQVWLTKDEYYDLTKKARKAGITTSSFVRHAVEETEVKPVPDTDVAMLIREIRRVGYNVDQTLRRANASGIVDMPQFRKDMADIRKAVEMVTSAYGDN